MKSDEILIKTFDQVKNDNFDQVKFDQVIVCRQNTIFVQMDVGSNWVGGILTEKLNYFFDEN